MSLPHPPWEAKPSKPVRAPLSADRIVEAALNVLINEGYEAVSMRRVAQELGTGAASLYAHVTNKSELDGLILDRVASELQVPEPDPERWREQVADYARDVLRVLRSYPGVARAAIAYVPVREHSLVATERLLRILRAGGVPDQAAAYAVDLLPLYITATAFEESVRGAQGWTVEEATEWIGQLRQYFAELPPDRFPLISSLAGQLTAGDGDERFEFGIQVIIAGLASLATTP